MHGSGLRVQGSGLRVHGSGLRVQGLGCGVQGSGLRVQGLGCGKLKRKWGKGGAMRCRVPPPLSPRPQTCSSSKNSSCACPQLDTSSGPTWLKQPSGQSPAWREAGGGGQDGSSSPWASHRPGGRRGVCVCRMAQAALGPVTGLEGGRGGGGVGAGREGGEMCGVRGKPGGRRAGVVWGWCAAC